MRLLLCIIVLGLVLLFVTRGIRDQELCNAIFIAEGGLEAKYLYGITSVPYDDIKEAREICLRTIRNQKKRHRAHECGLTYLECLAKRYCPYDTENWLKNVKYYY